jgi:hypothetical protein
MHKAFSLIRVYFQLTVRANFISIAFATSHLGTAILKTFPEAAFDCLTFLNCVHCDPLSIIKTPQ